MLGIGLLSIALSVAAEPAEGDRASRLAVIQKAPEFTLTDQDAKEFKSADLKGKVLLVSFVFTTCNGTCPATTHRMGAVQQELKTRGMLKGDRVRLVSITLDPARDTADVLKGYAKLYDADTSSWSFLTGGVEVVNKVVDAWGMWAKPAANGQLDHPSRIFLVDRKGQIREIYHLGFLKTAWVVEDIELLLNEK
jgi:protein SCO1/2